MQVTLKHKVTSSSRVDGYDMPCKKISTLWLLSFLKPSQKIPNAL